MSVVMSYNERLKIDDMFTNPDTRANFEMVSGLAPLNPDSPNVGTYLDGFDSWALKRLHND
jgi:hypothetical protein